MLVRDSVDFCTVPENVTTDSEDVINSCVLCRPLPAHRRNNIVREFGWIEFVTAIVRVQQQKKNIFRCTTNLLSAGRPVLFFIIACFSVCVTVKNVIDLYIEDIIYI